jgi:hypothetical protein
MDLHVAALFVSRAHVIYDIVRRIPGEIPGFRV